MTRTALLPDNCTTMAQVRAGVDETDRALLALLETRFAYMRAAARIKQSRSQVRDERRKAEVIANAAALADQAGLPQQVITDLWDMLVESSIAYELETWDKTRK
ncbi:MAG: chorismate mutase [Sphingomonadaceae bacterium]